MAQIHNTELFKEIRDGIKLQQLSDVVPSQLADKVVPVMEVNPKLLRVMNIFREASKATTGVASNVYTTPAIAEFYLCGVTLAHQSDVVADNTDIRVTANIDGVSRVLIKIPKINITAKSDFVTVIFPMPIKIDKAASINYGSTFSVGVCTMTVSIFGYTVDNPLA